MKFSDRHTVELMTNFYITFYPTTIDHNQINLDFNNVLEKLNANEKIHIVYCWENIKEFTLTLKSFLNKVLDVTNDTEIIHLAVANSLIIDSSILE